MTALFLFSVAMFAFAVGITFATRPRLWSRERPFRG